MKNMKLTAAGAELLGTAHADGESRYWIGYYGLAYVADRETDSISMAAQSGKLTEHGDYIYNIWQGDMLNGYAQNNPEDTAAASLYGLTLYDKSIRTNYRYVYDPDTGRNRLVAWKSESTGTGENTLVRKGVAVYYGATGDEDSDIPLPAPLYYGGEPSETGISSLSGDADGVPVSADYRYYVGTRDGGAYGWKDSSYTQGSDIVSDSGLLESISNFNKFHGTVSSEGYGVSSVSSCHNMSRSTKLFPISYYSVVNDNGGKLAETKYADNSPARKPLATAIKFSIDLSPVTADAGYTAIEYEAGDTVDDQATEERELYESKYVSFRFNRIGIYAVPMTVHRYSTDSSTDECNLQKVQFEIDGNAEPVLFAVADVNETVISDNPSSGEGGVAKFTLDFILHIGNGDKETSVEQRTAVYYDLYENDATTWYKNQLIASASISEAVTDLSLEMNAIKQKVGESGNACCTQDLDASKYALKNHTHDYLKNLVDGVDRAGSVRGIHTAEEGDGSDIDSVFGIYDGAPAGTVKSCVLQAIPTWKSGESDEVPESYVYCTGFQPAGEVAGCIEDWQLSAIIKANGLDWVANNVIGSSGWMADGDTTVYDSAHAYVWVGETRYAKIDLGTGNVEFNDVNLGSNPLYQMVILSGTTSEQMFSSGYSEGTDSLVLGEDTAASGKHSLIQGSSVHADGDYDTVLGSDRVTCKDSPYVTVTGATGFRVRNCSRSIVFGNGMFGDATAPTELRNVTGSVVGGSFHGEGDLGMSNGIDSSMWLATTTGADSCGAKGTVSGAFISGDIRLGKDMGDRSALNSVILRTGVSAGTRTYGPILNSFMAGDGASDYGASGSHDVETDTKIAISDSLSISGSLHTYLTTAESKWCGFIDESVEVPGIDHSVQIGGNACRSLLGTLMIAGDDTELARFSINTRLANESGNLFGASDSLLVGSDSQYGECLESVAVVGSGNRIPDGTKSSLLVGEGNGYSQSIRYDDEVYTREEFNDMMDQGTLTRGKYYVILGSGTVKSADGTTINLNGETDDAYAVMLNAAGKVIYSPVMKRERMNPRNLVDSMLVGSDNLVGGSHSEGLNVVGHGNSALLIDLDNVSMIGDGIHLDGSMPRAYGESSGNPLYAGISDAHFFGSGLSLDLTSSELYATHSFGKAIVNLDASYDQEILGIYARPSDYGLQVETGKPNVPMVYTGGIALAGYPSGTDNFGLLKLGHLSVSSSYVSTNPVYGWTNGRMLNPASVVGTTSCPFGGMVLAVDDTQETDGTMHLILSRGGTGTDLFAYDNTYADISSDTTISLENGKVYVISRSTMSSATITLDGGNMRNGDECVVHPKSAGIITVAIGTHTGGTTTLDPNDGGYLMRKVSYIAVAGAPPQSRLLVTKLFY